MPNLSHLKIGKSPAAFAEFAAKHNEVVSLIESIEAATGIDIKIVSTPNKRLQVGGTQNKQTGAPRSRIRIGVRQPSITGQINQTVSGGGGGGVANTLYYNDGTTTISINGTYGVQVNRIGGSVAMLSISGQIYSSSNSGTSQFLYEPNAATFSLRNGSRYTNVTNSGFTHSDGTNTVAIDPTGVTVNGTSVYTATVVPQGLGVASNSSGTASWYPFGGAILGSNGTGFQVDKDSIVLNGGVGGSLQIDRSNITHNMSIKTITVCNGNTSMSMLVIASDPF